MDQVRLLAVLLATMTIGVLGGCDRGDSSSNPSPAPAAPSSGGSAPSASADPADASDDAAAGDSSKSSAPAAGGATAKLQTPDVALPPSVDGEPVKAGFIYYNAKAKPAALGDFHRNDLQAKGWKLARSESAAVAGTKLTGLVQEYVKGRDVLTVALTEQIAGEGDLTMVSVMDIPVPPKAKAIAAFPFTILETTEPPDDAAAWLKKELTARGWAAGGESAAGIANAVDFKKAGRNLQAQVMPLGGGKSGARVQLMHTQAAE
jgi:hypothetical protein